MHDFQITSHAIDQFIRRWRQDKTPAQAKEELEALLRTSKIESKASFGGHIRVSGHCSDIRMVIKERNVLVTVLPPRNSQEDLIALMQEEAEHNKKQQDINTQNIQQEIKDAEKQCQEIERERQSLLDQHRELGVEKDKVRNQLQQLKNKLHFEMLFDFEKK